MVWAAVWPVEGVLGGGVADGEGALADAAVGGAGCCGWRSRSGEALRPLWLGKVVPGTWVAVAAWPCWSVPTVPPLRL